MNHKGTKGTKGAVEDQVQELLDELRVFGFAAAKEIARLRGQTGGKMACPLCQRTLRFRVSPSNGHMWCKCETANCLNAME